MKLGISFNSLFFNNRYYRYYFSASSKFKSMVYYILILIQLFLGDESFTILGEIGKGAYAKVLKASNSSGKNTVALKIEKPACRWEYYIAKEIQSRVPPKFVSCLSQLDWIC